MNNSGFDSILNADLIDQYYERWRQAPDSVEESWQTFFRHYDAENADGAPGPIAATATTTTVTTELQPQTPPQTLTQPEIATTTPTGPIDPKKQARFTGALYAYRSIGHTQAHFNPIKKIQKNPRLSLHRLGYEPQDLDNVYDTGNYLGGLNMTLRQLLEDLSATYCGPIGVEYLHIQKTEMRRWLQAKMEPTLNRPAYSRKKKIRILEKVLEAEIFEKFLHRRYVGQKRFGLEGGETLIPCLDALIEKCPSAGIKEIVMGMAHRGRLNVLANILGKSYEFLFHEFSQNYVPDSLHGDGDVKYHLGYDAEIGVSSGQLVGMRLAANPSHLEAVNPVVEGRVRALQRIFGDTQRKQVLPILIHGDAAFAGQGLVSEVLNLSQLKGYTTGGTIHIVINNQIGFTTDPTEARSSLYCTDAAKIVEAPIFHVNGDDPISTVYITELALQYRQKFGADVVIDMYCYRRHGHNESDEPSFTQPKLYKQISTHPFISETYANRLIADGDLTKKEAQSLQQQIHQTLEEAFQRQQQTSAQQNKANKEAFIGSSAIFQPPYSFRSVKTSVSPDILAKIAQSLTTLPANFTPNPKIKRQLQTKWKQFQKDRLIDWAFAESLAWGALMLNGTPVRLSGQDCARGTFSQRHAVLYDMKTREPYIPLMDLENRRSIFCVHNSLLSEAAVLGFDFGYSIDYSQMLCIWEAQFGDFANGAQVIIDQFIAGSESKWQLVSGIILLLPHGYEGQGPEHSSARLERYLQLCAEDNMQVCNLTTPAQYFHIMRRQMKRDFRKPLIIMAPKSLLRSKQALSPLDQFTNGSFHEILDDPQPPTKTKTTRIILCSGKVYYDLINYRRENKITNAAILRIEQLYPLHKTRLQKLIQKYQNQGQQNKTGKEKSKTNTHPNIEIIWCQEESQNMGAWSYIAPQIEEITGHKPTYAGRDASASTAVGVLTLHKLEQQNLVKAALTS